MRVLWLTFIALILAMFPAAARKHGTPATLVEAYTQRTIPGIPGAKIQTATGFILVWMNTQLPDSVFWYGDSGWMGGKLLSARRNTGYSPDRLTRKDYLFAPLDRAKFKSGDTLALVPALLDSSPIIGLSGTAVNTLIWRYGKKLQKLSVPPGHIIRKQDIVLP